MTFLSRSRSLLTASFAAGALAASVFSAPASAAADDTVLVDTVSYTTPGQYTFTLPADASVYLVEMRVAGGAGGSTCVAGGLGGSVWGVAGARGADQLGITVGGEGESVTTTTGRNVASGGSGGGGGSRMSGNGHRIAGGGGASSVELRRKVGVSEDLLVGSGGGGAGACGTHGTTGGAGGARSDGGRGGDNYNEYADVAAGGAAGGLGASEGRGGGDGEAGGGGGGAGRKGGIAGGGGSSVAGGVRSGAGGGGSGSDHISPVVDRSGAGESVERGDGSVTIVIRAVVGEVDRDTILLGDAGSEAAHGVVAFPAGQVRTGVEAGVSRRYSSVGDANFNFRYDSLVMPRRVVTLTVTETYPGGAATQRNYGIYLNNTLVHTRSASSSSETLKTYTITVDGASFNPEKTLQVMIKNTGVRWGSSIHRIELTASDG